VLSEEVILKGCLQDNLKCQEALYRLYYSYAMSVALRYAPDREDALEILNDAFLKVFRQLHKYDKSKPFKAWFRKVLINTALDHLRSSKKHREQIMMDISTCYDIREPEQEADLDLDNVLQIFKQLPEIQRAVFNLHKIEGYQHDEIASILQIAPGTSRSHLSRAIGKLQSLLQVFNEKQV
jgi:RNA polymerase sigma factor (sigma-70 family)